MLRHMAEWSDLMRRVERAHGVVLTADLIAAGLSQGQVETLVRHERLVTVGRGAWRVRGAPDTREARILGAILSLEGDVWASHRTAAWLHAIPVHGPVGLVEVTRRYGTSANRGSVLVHRSTRVLDHHVVEVRGIPCTSVPRTMFDLARRTGPKVYDRAVEHVLRHELCTVGALHVVLAELGGKGRPGTVRMRQALAERDRTYVPTSSELTAVGREVLAPVPGIEWEVAVSDAQGYIRRVDGLVRHAGVVIEFDGRRWHGQPSDVAHDEAGDARLAAVGLVVERCTWSDLTRHPDAVLAKVLRLVASGPA
jgi:hypothetical protein